MIFVQVHIWISESTFLELNIQDQGFMVSREYLPEQDTGFLLSMRNFDN